jgi:hypothetical protein
MIDRRMMLQLVELSGGGPTKPAQGMLTFNFYLAFARAILLGVSQRPSARETSPPGRMTARHYLMPE